MRERKKESNSLIIIINYFLVEKPLTSVTDHVTGDRGNPYHSQKLDSSLEGMAGIFVLRLMLKRLSNSSNNKCLFMECQSHQQRQTGGSYILKLQEHTLISSPHMRLTYSLINIQIITTQPSLSQTHTHTGKSGFSYVLPVIAQFALKWKNKSVAWIFYFQMHYKS